VEAHAILSIYEIPAQLRLAVQVARLRQRAVEYRLALAWARLEALLGGPEELTRLVGAVKKEERK
jgi:hypothetical protein